MDDSIASLDDQQLATLVQQRRQAQVEAIKRELAEWLESHNVILQAMCGFSPDGRHMTEIQVVLKN